MLKEPGRKALGDGISAFRVANHRPWTKCWGSTLTTFSSAAMRLLPENH